MKKTLVALATLAVAGGAAAQVTISGYFGASYDNFSISNKNALRTGNTDEQRVSDQASRIIFGVKEDLGGGLSAIGQFDLRFKIDATSRLQSETSTVPTADPVSGGNNHIGLAGGFGTVRLGRQDIYYVDTPSFMPAGLYTAANMSPVYHSLAGANTSRTPNLAWWVSPRVNGFEGTVAYSTNPIRTSGTNEVENDMGTTNAQRKGSGYMLRLNYTSGPLDATIATMDYKSDYIGGTATTGSGAGGAITNGNSDQKGTNLVVKYSITNQLKVALGMSNGETTAYNAAGVAGAVTKANAHGFGVSYDMGKWNFAMHQANRGNQKADGVEAANTGKSITSLAATYSFSKRTAAGLMFTSLKSDSATSTGLFYQSNNVFGGQMTNLNGETQNITSLAVRHSF